MKAGNQLALLVWFITALCSASLLELPQAMLTIRVVGEDGLPIPGANAGITFEQVVFGRGLMPKPNEGVTNNKGEFSATGGTTGDVHYGADRAGYYETVGTPYDFQGEPQNGRWQPWNPTFTVVLKKIIHPVPMYAKKVQAEIPVENKPIGFDLQVADWVAPHGKGRVPDFVFQFTRRYANRRDYDCRLQLTFSNQEDGIQPVFANSQYGSRLRLSHNAPTTGYEPTWERLDSYSKPAPVGGNQNYFFRVRAKTTDGTVKKALYGKIHGHIRIAGYGAPKPTIIFTYYLNPDGSPNVEFDPKRNLFKDLGPSEGVNQP